MATTDEFADRVFHSVIAAQETQALYLGDQLGWYKALSDNGALTAPQLASKTSSNARYTREWLEHQAVSGYVTVDDESAGPDERKYTLPPEHAEVLLDIDSLSYIPASFVGVTGKHIDAIANAYRTGGGVDWDTFGDVARQAQANQNRPLFLHSLGRDLLPQIPELHERLQSGGRVADIGCGYGWSSIGIAKSYPGVAIDGFDIDKPSIEVATRNAIDAGMSKNVSFVAANAADVVSDNIYDAVFAFECVHDMPDPVGVLRAVRNMTRDDGFVIIMDEGAQERFSAPGSDLEQLLYGYSLMVCLPDGMSTKPSRATGTVMRPETLAQYATEAGYSRTEILPVEHDFFRFYRLHL